MEPSGRNQRQPWQMERPRKPLKQADPQPIATHRNRSGAHGKEGVDGSSPSEGLQIPRTPALSLQPELQRQRRAVGLEPFISSSYAVPR